MQVRVLYFASFRDAAGRQEESRDLPDGSRVEDLWRDLSASVPSFARYPMMPPAAVNREYVDAGRRLSDGDEVAFLPPIAGGSSSPAHEVRGTARFLSDQPIDLAEFLGQARASDGAVCVFVGVVRNESEGRPTVASEYEAYGAMAETELARIADSLADEFPQARVLIRHRVGRLAVGEPSVAIVATAPHREDAFSACRAAIERIKKTVPIWKREIRADGSSEWVDPTRA